ncbi:MAG: hypothetical protein ACLR6B_17890 [Blautia sp.]
MMPEKLENFSDFIHTRNRITKEAYTLGDEGIILAEKTAKMLGVKSGGSITVESTDGKEVEVPVAEICENYMQNFAYISPAFMRSSLVLFRKQTTFSSRERILLMRQPLKRPARNF